jgi:DNA-binding response OmpR family regulator
MSVSEPMNHRRIVIVDDDDNSREPFAAFLRISGFEVDEFETGEDALASISRNVPAAVVLDITLSGDIDGFECARRLRALDRDLVLVAMTGHSAPQVRKEGVAFDAIFTKPVDPDALVLALERCLPQPQP